MKVNGERRDDLVDVANVLRRTGMERFGRESTKTSGARRGCDVRGRCPDRRARAVGRSAHCPAVVSWGGERACSPVELEPAPGASEPSSAAIPRNQRASGDLRTNPTRYSTFYHAAAATTRTTRVLVSGCKRLLRMSQARIMTTFTSSKSRWPHHRPARRVLLTRAALRCRVPVRTPFPQTGRTSEF